jgi:hypothetical protein
MKILPVGANLFHMDGQTHKQTDTHDETNSRLSQVCDTPRNGTRADSATGWKVSDTNGTSPQLLLA